MKTAIITGASGLIGSEAVAFLHKKFDSIVGIDNDMRQYFFGQDAPRYHHAICGFGSDSRSNYQKTRKFGPSLFDWGFG